MTSTEKTPRALTIVGPGKVGRSLHQAATAAGLESQLLNRDSVDAGEFSRPGRNERPAITLLAVPDAEISRACETLVTSGQAQGPVGHMSGATTLDALAAAAAAGLTTFSLHPLQSFANGETALQDIPCAVTASDAETKRVVAKLAVTLGMRPFDLDDENRAAYHAAASMASNFLVCLEQEAADLFAAIGIEDGRRLLAPLVDQTLRNWIEKGPEALTGPIARGDEETVSRHQEALSEVAPQLLPAYVALAERTRSVAKRAVERPQNEAVVA